MKKKIIILLPIIFIGISAILINQTRSTRNDYRENLETSTSVELSAFEQLQKATNKELIDLGEALISFVHFDDVNAATVTTETKDITFPLTVTDPELNNFSIETLIASPESFIIGDTFGLATDQSGEFYYYPLIN
ncbi:hypothetical protein [Enterococcus sp. NPDC086594]|uniref:hypothetical protein n=1 Tax=Enterococcus sp. NPDC086594 TaxID=3363992 RepID=UPI003829CB89